MFKGSGNLSHLLLSSAILLLSLTLVVELALWILLLALLAWLLRLSLYLKWHKHLPTVRTLNLLSVLCAIALAYTSWEQELLSTMVNLLFMAMALKLMLMRRTKDYFQLIAASTFAIGVALVFNHNIVFALCYAILQTLLLLSLALHVSPSIPLQTHIRDLTQLGLKALPIALALVVLIPQIGPLWSMPGPGSSETGLSEQVTPGDIAQLSQSDDLAFRATFDGPRPTTAQMYWRAIVMEEFDGSTWRIDTRRKGVQDRYWLARQPYRHQPQGSVYRYEILAEPTQQRWLYGLDIAVAAPDKAWHRRDFTLVSPIALQSPYQYQLRSYYQQALASPLPNFDRLLGLALPASGNPRTRQWIASLRSRHPAPQDLIFALKRHFSTGYRYTLSPPLMPANSVDALLFDHKAGFCSHYASALAFALRLADIPARMVTGYLGGEVDDSGYVSVFQYDAHAWVEAYLDGQWQRIDPTAWVSPIRISQGLAEAVAYEGTFLKSSPFSLTRLSELPLFNYLRLALADVDYQWSRWVLGFDRRRQQDLYLSLMSMFNISNLIYLTLGVFALAVLTLAFLFRHYWLRPAVDPVEAQYRKALLWLGKKGFRRRHSQGPEDFARQVAGSAPMSIGEVFGEITSVYVTANYDSRHSQLPAQTAQRLKHLNKRLRRAKH